MIVKNFSRQVSSYIDYYSILNAITQLKTNPAGAMEQSVLLLGSEVLTSAAEWDLYPLFKDYLSEFKIPQESIDLISKTEKKEILDDSAISWLSDYKFSGKLQGNPTYQSTPTSLKFVPLIAIEAESCILDILYTPANFLINAVEVYSQSWRKVKEKRMRVYFEPGASSELFIYIEKRIASTYELLEKNNPGEKSGNSIFNGYRYVCVTSDTPVDPKMIQIAKEAAFFQANSTLS